MSVAFVERRPSKEPRTDSIRAHVHTNLNFVHACLHGSSSLSVTDHDNVDDDNVADDNDPNAGCQGTTKSTQ
jgi:hypothetical protein